MVALSSATCASSIAPARGKRGKRGKRVVVGRLCLEWSMLADFAAAAALVKSCEVCITGRGRGERGAYDEHLTVFLVLVPHVTHFSLCGCVA